MHASTMHPETWLAVCFWPGGFLLVLAIGLIFGRRRYKYPFAGQPPGAGWVETAERFRDPVSGEDVVVWYQPRTGERAYVRR